MIIKYFVFSYKLCEKNSTKVNRQQLRNVLVFFTEFISVCVVYSNISRKSIKLCFPNLTSDKNRRK